MRCRFVGIEVTHRYDLVIAGPATSRVGSIAHHYSWDASRSHFGKLLLHALGRSKIDQSTKRYWLGLRPYPKALEVGTRAIIIVIVFGEAPMLNSIGP